MRPSPRNLILSDNSKRARELGEKRKMVSFRFRRQIDADLAYEARRLGWTKSRLLERIVIDYLEGIGYKLLDKDYDDSASEL